MRHLNLPGLDYPAHTGSVDDAGYQGYEILPRPSQMREIRLGYLLLQKDLVSSCSVHGIVGYQVAYHQVFDAPEEVMRPSVVSGQSYISVPRAGILKVRRPKIEIGPRIPRRPVTA